MKTKNLCLLATLIAGLNLIPAGRVTAQTFTTLHSFTATNGVAGTNSDGANPWAGLITNSSGTTLYGTALSGGSSGNGTVFAVNTDGTGFTNLHSFTASANNGNFSFTNSDGAAPRAGLILSGNILYGTARSGGSSGAGTVFAVNTNGTGFTNLHDFTYSGSDGANPSAGLILSGNNLYGTAFVGGSLGSGTVFALNTDGTGFTTLHTFTWTDGDHVYAGLILSGNTLYGAAVSGGSSGWGTVFAVNTDGAGFTNLHSFTAISDPYYTNSDGANPYAGLIVSGNTLYGTAIGGGSSGRGTVFAFNTNGTDFTNLHDFTALVSSTNNDGSGPISGLVLSGNTLYGTAAFGSSSGRGTVFAVNTNGTGFTNLHDFTALVSGTNNDGANPSAGFLLSGNTLYGTARNGGSSGSGTVFSLSFRPQLAITPSGTNVILTWPANVAGFDYTGYTLQSATSPGSPIWSTNSPAPVVIAGQNTVTNPITGAQRFYRLTQ